MSSNSRSKWRQGETGERLGKPERRSFSDPVIDEVSVLR
jgi:hypothetical protein